MPRNASGTYTIPIAAFAPGGVIKASDHNSNNSDIAQALTQSLATTGVSVMTGPIKAAQGNSGAPTITFANAQATGFYLAGANQIGWTANGAAAGTFNADGSLAIAGLITSAGSPLESFATGTILVCGNAAAPTHWTKLVAQNDALMRIVSGTPSTGGTVAFSTFFSAAITNLAAHTHTGTTGTESADHTHSYNLPTTANYNTVAGATSMMAQPTPLVGQTSGGKSATHTHSFTSASTGSGATTTYDVKYVDFIMIQKV